MRLSAPYDLKDDADEPLEETQGGFVGAGAENLTPIKLSFGPLLAQLPGKLKLSATNGGNHIRLWRDAQRGEQVVLPAVWQNPSQIPTTLYVEGVTPSANVRDVELSLEYDENTNGQSNPRFKCTDKIALTVVKALVSGNSARIVNVESTNCFPNQIDMMNPLSIEWFYSMNNGKTWFHWHPIGFAKTYWMPVMHLVLEPDAVLLGVVLAAAPDRRRESKRRF